jgi:iron complex outermembrane receptor protein
MKKRARSLLLFGFLILWSLSHVSVASAQNQVRPGAAAPGADSAESPRTTNLADLTFEQLLNITISSASRKSESLSGAPAAIFVVTAEDIHRGGFTSLPEVLRMVPGLYVAQSNSHTWAVSARGFSDINNNKMLVLIDGRSVYTPLFGGVFWDAQDIPLEDVDRIEVIRGPGGTLWGANAVNGVINVITKSSVRTQGTSVVLSTENDDGYAASARYGGKIGEHLSYRIFGRSKRAGPFVDAFGSQLYDTWGLAQGGMRVDAKPSARDTLMVEGSGYDGRIRDEITGVIDSPAPPYVVSFRQAYPVKGGYALGQWDHKFSDRSSTQVFADCSWQVRDDRFAGDDRNTCDLELQHTLAFNSRHSLIWGGSFNSTASVPTHSFGWYFTPSQRRDYVESGFAQYEVAVVPDRLRLTGGAKLEHNSYTDFEVQPQIRAVWTPTKAQSFWAAVSRAVRTPSQYQSDLVIKVGVVPGEVPIFTTMFGNPRLQPEVLRAYELGYRYQPRRTFSFDVATYYNDYQGLIAPGPAGAPYLDPSGSSVVVPFSLINTGGAQTHGGELSAKWAPVARWQISMAVTELRGSQVATATSPRHQFSIQSRIDLAKSFKLDSVLYHYNATQPTVLYNSLTPFGVPTSNRVDMGFTWQVSQALSLSLWGRNLQSSHHPEASSDGVSAPYQYGDVRRSVVFRLAWESAPEKRGAH